MSGINWGLAQMPDIGGNALAAFDQGRKQAKEKRTEEAWGAYAANPDDPNALNALAQYDPKSVIALRQDMTKRQADARTTQVEQAKQTAAILRQVQANPASYPMARQAAIRGLGIPAANIPEQYDPEWVGQQVMLHSAFEKDGGVSLTNAAKQVGELGYDLNSPEGKTELARLINAGNVKTYTDDRGYTRIYDRMQVRPAGAPAPQGAPQGQPRPQTGEQPFTFDMFKGYRDTQGDKKAAEYVRKFGFRVSVQSPDQARQLPSGTPITLPDGTEGVVP